MILASKRARLAWLAPHNIQLGGSLKIRASVKSRKPLLVVRSSPEPSLSNQREIGVMRTNTTVEELDQVAGELYLLILRLVFSQSLFSLGRTHTLTGVLQNYKDAVGGDVLQGLGISLDSDGQTLHAHSAGYTLRIRREPDQTRLIVTLVMDRTHERVNFSIMLCRTLSSWVTLDVKDYMATHGENQTSVSFTINCDPADAVRAALERVAP